MPRDRRARPRFAGLGVALAVGLLAPCLALAQGTPPAKKLWSKDRGFRIPVTLSTKNPGRTRELILYVSDDHGANWKKSTRTTPDSLEFQVRVPRDGEYWFAVQTVDVDGKLYPSGDKQVEPTLCVIVDATKPIITLEPVPRRGSDAGVRWEVQDSHLLLNTLMLEYQSEGAADWRQVPLDTSEYKLIGVKMWDAGTADVIRARMSVRDRAGNIKSIEQILPDGLAANPGPAVADARSVPPRATQIATRTKPVAEGDGFGPVDAPSSPNRGSTEEPTDVLPPSHDPDFANDPPQPRRDPDFANEAQQPQTAPRTNPAAAAGPTLLVPNPKFPLRYEVEDAGPDGPALVELWTTRDGGRTWNRQPGDPDRVSPYNVDLGGEGTYGLWLVVQSASGLGDPPPAPGDRPQSWVEVDSAAPAVSIDRPRVGTGVNAGKVVFTWRAGDAHMAQRPISIFYRSDGPDAPWVPIAQGLDNNGRYVWNAPTNVPPRFHVKVEALDTLGNRGLADTQDLGPVVLDRARPRGRIIGLDTSGPARQ
jgi:hypothetical protein